MGVGMLKDFEWSSPHSYLTTYLHAWTSQGKSSMMNYIRVEYFGYWYLVLERMWQMKTLFTLHKKDDSFTCLLPLRVDQCQALGGILFDASILLQLKRSQQLPMNKA